MSAFNSHCESCGESVPEKGHYEVTMIQENGNHVSWFMDKIACVLEFARKYSHLDQALPGFKFKDADKDDDET